MGIGTHAREHIAEFRFIKIHFIAFFEAGRNIQFCIQLSDGLRQVIDA